MMATGKHNIGMIVMGIVLVVGFAAAVLFYSESVAKWKYLLAIPVLYGSVAMLLETEDPVEPGTFIRYLIFGAAPTIILLLLNASERGVIH